MLLQTPLESCDDKKPASLQVFHLKMNKIHQNKKKIFIHISMVAIHLFQPHTLTFIHLYNKQKKSCRFDLQINLTRSIYFKLFLKTLKFSIILRPSSSTILEKTYIGRCYSQTSPSLVDSVVALIPSRSVWQMLTIFSGVEF